MHTLPREKITKHVMLALMKEPTAKLFSNHRLSSCDFEQKVATFDTVTWKGKTEMTKQDSTRVAEEKPTTGTTSDEDKKSSPANPISGSSARTVHFDFLIGADGSYSTVRQFMMRKLHMNYSQEYLDALWCDFFIPAADDRSYRMDSTCLHVWPAKASIVMAQPDFVSCFGVKRPMYKDSALMPCPGWLFPRRNGLRDRQGPLLRSQLTRIPRLLRRDIPRNCRITYLERRD